MTSTTHLLPSPLRFHFPSPCHPFFPTSPLSPLPPSRKRPHTPLTPTFSQAPAQAHAPSTLSRRFSFPHHQPASPIQETAAAARVCKKIKIIPPTPTPKTEKFFAGPTTPDLSSCAELPEMEGEHYPFGVQDTPSFPARDLPRLPSLDTFSTSTTTGTSSTPSTPFDETPINEWRSPSDVGNIFTSGFSMSSESSVPAPSPDRHARASSFGLTPPSKFDRNRKRLSISLVPSPTAAEHRGSLDLGKKPDEFRARGGSLGRSFIPAPLNVPARFKQGHRKTMSLLSVLPLPPSHDMEIDLPGPGKGIRSAMITEERRELPYEDGPKEIVPGLFLGSEESLWLFESWAKGVERVAIINVAQELTDPFLEGEGGKGVYPAVYEGGQGRPGVEYAKVEWSHGEGELSLRGKEGWGFWEAIAWMEEARSRGLPVLVHCQCGISRSSTLVIAYILYLVRYSLLPDSAELAALRGKGIMEVYDWVKGRSRWVGPNVSLIVQLLEWEKVLNAELGSTEISSQGEKAQVGEGGMSGEEMKREAEELDREMRELKVVKKLRDGLVI